RTLCRLGLRRASRCQRRGPVDADSGGAVGTGDEKKSGHRVIGPSKLLRFSDRPMVRSPDLIDLRGQNEIRLGQPIHRVRPGCDFNLAPAQQDVGMMTLLSGQRADPVHESQGGLKVGKLVGAHKMMFVDDLPLRGLRQLTMNFRKFVALQRRNATATGNAISVCKHKAAYVESLS